MTLHIEVLPPDTSEVKPGTLWRMDTGWEALVLDEIGSTVFNVIYWPDGKDMSDPAACGSMVAADVLALSSELIACPLPPLLAMIEEAFGRSE